MSTTAAVHSVAAHVHSRAASDRSRDLRQVIRLLAEAVASGNVDKTLCEVFEEGVRDVLPGLAIRLRDVEGSHCREGERPGETAGAVAIDVPTGDRRRPAVLEARFDRDHEVDERSMDTLATAAMLGALVLGADRGRSPGRVLAARRTGAEGAARLIGSTGVMKNMRERVARVAGTDFTVLVEGESGTGKELVARCLHEWSARSKGPFVAVNCAAIVDTLLEAELFGIEERTATGVRGRLGKFEQANRGTLFLDEVSDLSPAAQAKLLRAIQEMAIERVGGRGSTRINVRIVAASNRPLAELVAAGSFRRDLFYRLSGVEILVPPLRSRPEDIPELIDHFLDRHRHTRLLTLAPSVTAALLLHEWPGNVRELERLIERVVALSGATEVQVNDLPPKYSWPPYSRVGSRG